MKYSFQLIKIAHYLKQAYQVVAPRPVKQQIGSISFTFCDDDRRGRAIDSMDKFLEKLTKFAALQKKLTTEEIKKQAFLLIALGDHIFKDDQNLELKATVFKAKEHAVDFKEIPSEFHIAIAKPTKGKDNYRAVYFDNKAGINFLTGRI